MQVLRSLLFNAAFYAWAILILILWTPTRLSPSRKAIVHGMTIWALGVDRLLRIVGITTEIRGREHLPSGPVLVASKHQSAWDTVIFHAVLDDPAIVVKQELLHIPLYGGFVRKSGMIPIDRDAGANSLRGLVKEARARVAEGRPIMIFPEGHRVAPDAHEPYRPGTAALYKQLGIPCVPVALNSGLFWPRRSFMRRPGRIVLEFLPPIPAGLNRREFAATLEATIETATARLMAEARTDARAPAGRPRAAGT